MGVKWEIDFDYAEFEKQLYDASLKAFAAVQEDHKDETFYVFGLTSSVIFETVGITANTIRGLGQTAKEQHKKHSQTMEISLEDVNDYYRYQWWTYDNAYSRNYRKFFDTPSGMLNDFDNKTGKMIDNNENYIHDPMEINQFLIERIERIFLKVLTRLDGYHIFEKTNDRQNIVLQLNRGGFESGDDWTISMINPPTVFSRYEVENKRATEIGERISEEYYRKRH